MKSGLPSSSWIERLIGFCQSRKLVVFLAIGFLALWGAIVAPFDWDLGSLPRDPVPVDAIPDIGENQQIVFTEFAGRSSRDVEDQVTYPLTVALLGIPEVKTIRSFSMFGFSSIYVIFKEGAEFYWSRSRLLEKLASLPAGTLPPNIRPTLGPDATALGQVYWYTLEGRDPEGRPTGGWGPEELRTVQDFYVRYALQSAEGVSEVASVGGFGKEYQVEVDPEALRVAGVTMEQVVAAVAGSNLDIGARTMEVNRVEYTVRGIGYVKSVEDIEKAVVVARSGQPILVGDVATVQLGPALRRGALDKGGAEVVGGVVTVRYGENPLAAIGRVKAKIAEIAPGLPQKVLADGTVSRLTIVPFYDRTGLIKETLGTLEEAIYQQILVTVIVVLISVMHLRSAMVISALLPLSVLMSFIAMKLFGVDANIVALSGIAIAIGTLVDMGIIFIENILRHLDEAPADEPARVTVHRAASEVGGAVLTAVATTIIGFLPVFAMQAAEGKLFRPLAFTKTFALAGSVVVAITLIPPLAELLFARRRGGRRLTALLWPCLLLVAGVVAMFHFPWWYGLAAMLLGAAGMVEQLAGPRWGGIVQRLAIAVVVCLVTILLARDWLPLGPQRGLGGNLLFVGLVIGGFLLLAQGMIHFYPRILALFLRWKALFLLLPCTLVLLGGSIWLGFPTLSGWLPDALRGSRPLVWLAHEFPGLGKEFMPPLDEGSFLYMPTTMPHASLGEVRDVMAKQDMAISAIPEVEESVGKLGRAESPLDPAPVSMVEAIINYRSEYLLDSAGRRTGFRYEPEAIDYARDAVGNELPGPDGLPYLVRGKYPRDVAGSLIPADDGQPFRQWRPALDPALNPGRAAWPGIRTPEDIWDRIVALAQIPGSTSAPLLQPIAARIVMLQSGMRAPMGVKVRGPDLETIETVGLEIERLLKEVPGVAAPTVFADRVVGRPYLELVVDRNAIARYGLKLVQVQEAIETAVGGKLATTTVEGRERYPVRVRYARELRGSIEELGRILVATPGGEQIPLSQLTRLRYARGAQVVRSEDTFLTGYVIFDKLPDRAEVDVVEAARTWLQEKERTGELHIPAGVSYAFAGSYENQIRAQERLALVLPLALFMIFLVLYLNFDRLPVTLMVFSSILVAWSGGFLMVWLYSQPWFLNVSPFGVSLRELFQIHPINLSVAIWVGFLALFGIASDDGVIMATYLEQTREEFPRRSVAELRAAVVAGASRRIRPAMMTSTTTILALLPVLTSSGRGSDIMLPMAIPSFGGMSVALLTLFVVPVLYCWWEERGLPREVAA